MEDKRIEELIGEINAILEPYNLVVCITKKPKQFKTRIVRRHGLLGRNNVRARREAMGLTERQLATQMGVDRNIVVRVEDEDMAHTFATMQKFATFFGCEVEDLLTEYGDE